MIEPPELTCQALVTLVTEYLEETLSAPERVRFDAHLANCPGCRAYLDQMRRTIVLLHELPEETISPEALQAFTQAFRDWKIG